MDSAWGESVVLKLMEQFVKGMNVTTDNFFTFLYLAKNLLGMNTSLIGNMKAARREPPLSANQSAELHSTGVLRHERVTMTIYQVSARRASVFSALCNRQSLQRVRGRRSPRPSSFTTLQR